MKKLLVALSLICMAAVETMAQIEFHWGFKGGINFTTYDSDCDDFQARMGQWGLLCRWNIGEHFAIQPEAFYARMGVRSLKKHVYHHTQEKPYHSSNYSKDVWYRDFQGNEDFTLNLLTDNIQEAIIFKYFLPMRNESLKGLNVHAGPLFSERFDYHISTGAELGYLADDDLNQVKKLRWIARAQNEFTIHAVCGIGYDSPSGIGLDIRWQTGITPVWDKDSRYGQYNSHSHDRVWAVCFSYTF